MRPRQLPPPQCSDNCLQPAERNAASEGRRDDKIGPPALFAIRDLGAQDIGKAAFAHPGPAHYPLALQACRRRHDQHKIAALDPAAFEEQRDVEDDERIAARAGARNKPPFGLANHRVDDPFKPAQRRRVAEHTLAQTLAIDPALRIAHFGKCRLNRPDRGPARRKQSMDNSIGVE